VFPDEVLRKLDDRKGKYLSRNKYLLQIVEEQLNEIENENNKKNGVGAPPKATLPPPPTYLVPSLR
jgi:metal-responsive CopG/Arc/MetJ family transcriptional regulator